MIDQQKSFEDEEEEEEEEEEEDSPLKLRKFLEEQQTGPVLNPPFLICEHLN